MAQSNNSGTSRRHRMEHDPTTLSSNRFDPEWEAREAIRQRELEEARARAAQMEKTMRWWSDCTANWREKWSKVRNERNKAREESKLLKSKLEAALKDTSSYKREKIELESINNRLRDEMTRLQQLIMRDWEEPKKADEELEEYVLQGAVPKHAIERYSSKDEEIAEGGGEEECSDRLSTHCPDKSLDVDYLQQKLSMLQLRLEESQKIINSEREERIQLRNSLDKAYTELAEAKGKAQELRFSKQEAVREILALQVSQQQVVESAQIEKQEDAAEKDSLDRRIAGLRAEVGALALSSPRSELERLQAENASEWGRRERLETEKVSLERENKKLLAEIRDLQERLEKRGKSAGDSAELRQIQQELSDKNKELIDLKHSHSKLKKVLQDKTTELAHAVRRAEQYEAEVKRLRSRVDELKRELASAEDEVDIATNNIRKLQRSNDELQEQIEGLQVQVRHLETRVRNSTSSLNQLEEDEEFE